MYIRLLFRRLGGGEGEDIERCRCLSKRDRLVVSTVRLPAWARDEAVFKSTSRGLRSNPVALNDEEDADLSTVGLEDDGPALALPLAVDWDRRPLGLKAVSDDLVKDLDAGATTLALADIERFFLGDGRDDGPALFLT